MKKAGQFTKSLQELGEGRNRVLGWGGKRAMAGGGTAKHCVFCQIARASTSTPLLYTDERVVAFPDINPSAFRHYLVIPIEHISTVKDLRRRTEDYQLVSHMLNVGQTLLQRDAPEAKQYRWKHLKYISLGPLVGFVEAEKLLDRIKPLSEVHT